MVAMVLPLRSIFHILCNVPASSGFSAAKATATLSQAAPRNPAISSRPIGTPKGYLSVSYRALTGVLVVNSLPSLDY